MLSFITKVSNLPQKMPQVHLLDSLDQVDEEARVKVTTGVDDDFVSAESFSQDETQDAERV